MTMLKMNSSNKNTSTQHLWHHIIKWWLSLESFIASAFIPCWYSSINVDILDILKLAKTSKFLKLFNFVKSFPGLSLSLFSAVSALVLASFQCHMDSSPLR